MLPKNCSYIKIQRNVSTSYTHSTLYPLLLKVINLIVFWCILPVFLFGKISTLHAFLILPPPFLHVVIPPRNPSITVHRPHSIFKFYSVKCHVCNIVYSMNLVCLNSFQYFAMINYAARTNFVHTDVSIFGSLSLGYVLRSGTSELIAGCICSLIKCCQTLDPNVLSICNLTVSVWRLCFLLFSWTVYCQAFWSLPIWWVKILCLQKTCEASIITFKM